jgi:hypothetical protein
MEVAFMLCLFRRKMVFVVKYFRRNQFQKKLFSRKYFSAFGSYEKITKSENANVAGCLAGSGQNCRIPAGHIRAGSDPAGSGHFGWISARSVAGSGSIRPDSGISGRISSRIRSYPAGSRLDQCPDPIKSGRIPAGFYP